MSDRITRNQEFYVRRKERSFGSIGFIRTHGELCIDTGCRSLKIRIIRWIILKLSDSLLRMKETGTPDRLVVSVSYGVVQRAEQGDGK